MENYPNEAHTPYVGFVSFICWIVLIVKAARGRYYKLPIIGDYAEKWANSLRD